MKLRNIAIALTLAVSMQPMAAGSLDPECVVPQWSAGAPSPKIIDINFSDLMWPDSWAGETARDCPDYSAGGYVNAIIKVPANDDGAVKYPVMFHNCTFANKASKNGFAGTTAAFGRQYYVGENAVGNATWGYNNWTSPGHTVYLEDNIATEQRGNKEVPVYGEAGFVQMCRDAATTDASGNKVSMHGWMEIDHIPYVDKVQWSWSSTSWGRGIKCDVKIGDGEWQPLVWMGSERQKQGWTVFSDQGYFMENDINDHDVSLRWRVWDGEDPANPVQVGDDGATPFTQPIDPMAQRQAPRVHKIRIFGNTLTESDAVYAEANALADPGELSDLSQYGVGGGGGEPVPDEPALAGLLAFPTAEGFGKYATGGRGGKVVKVTKLADDGSEGTLRWAFNQYKGEPITILLDVCGEIVLQSELRINRADWTLAGQTAPGLGVVITHNKVNLGGSSNFIVRNVRFRIGRQDTAGNILAENALGAENCSNFIFDHCSFGWSVEENINTADSHFLTVQHCIVHEGLYNAGHSKGARGYGGQFGGSPATYHHNLLAHNHSRSCRFNGARGEDQIVFIEYANNVNYNYGSTSGCYGGENTAAINSYNGLNSSHECNFINNYYKPGPGSNQSRCVFVTSSYARDGATSWAPSKWFVDGNIAHGFANITADNWQGMVAEVYTLDQIKAAARIIPELNYYKYTAIATVGNYDPAKYMLTGIEDATSAFDYVVDHAGPINRDAVETRIAGEVRQGIATYGGSLGRTSGFIDTENDAEGFFAYPASAATVDDSDGDGMPDSWEALCGLDASKPDNNVTNADGYTALEVYLASLMGETMNTDFTGGVEYVYVPAAMRYDRHTQMLSLGESTLGCRLDAYTPDGRLVHDAKVQADTLSLSHLPKGVIILMLSDRNNVRHTLKINR